MGVFTVSRGSRCIHCLKPAPFDFAQGKKAGFHVSTLLWGRTLDDMRQRRVARLEIVLDGENPARDGVGPRAADAHHADARRRGRGG
jgi:hypothetical protein